MNLVCSDCGHGQDWETIPSVHGAQGMGLKHERRLSSVPGFFCSVLELLCATVHPKSVGSGRQSLKLKSSAKGILVLVSDGVPADWLCSG